MKVNVNGVSRSPEAGAVVPVRVERIVLSEWLRMDLN